MKNIFRKEEITPAQKQINELKEDIRHCQRQMKRTRALFEMAVDEDLIEARIYEMKGLAKHYDYLVSTLKATMEYQQDNRVINI